MAVLSENWQAPFYRCYFGILFEQRLAGHGTVSSPFLPLLACRSSSKQCPLGGDTELSLDCLLVLHSRRGAVYLSHDEIRELRKTATTCSRKAVGDGVTVKTLFTFLAADNDSEGWGQWAPNVDGYAGCIAEASTNYCREAPCWFSGATEVT